MIIDWAQSRKNRRPIREMLRQLLIAQQSPQIKLLAFNKHTFHFRSLRKAEMPPIRREHH